MSRVRFFLAGSAMAVAMVGGLATGALRAQTPGQEGSAPAAVAGVGDVARGAYIVESVAQCGRCHTPVTSTGERDRSRWLAGGPLDVAPTIARENWAMAAPRIAGTPPGTDEQFVHLMMTGISRTGRAPLRPMPQFKMTREDADSVLAYLKSLGGRERSIHN